MRDPGRTDRPVSLGDHGVRERHGRGLLEEDAPEDDPDGLPVSEPAHDPGRHERTDRMPDSPCFGKKREPIRPDQMVSVHRIRHGADEPRELRMNGLKGRRQCPENCRYRRKEAPFCGYCMMEIIYGKRKEEEDDSRQNKAENTEQAER